MIFLDDFIVKQEDPLRSRKLYKMTCDKCGADRGYQRKKRHGLGLCSGCASSITHSGKIVTQQSKEKMSKSSYLKNGGIHPLAGKKHSSETKVKLSKAAALQNKTYKGKFEYKGLYMKSSWEVKYASYLDSIGRQWVYEPSFQLSSGYIYLPDFQLSTGDIIEIKGYMREDAQIKWNMFCVDYPNINKSLLRKDDLKKLGII